MGMPVGKRKSASGGLRRLSESEDGPLVTDISLLRTLLLSKPHIGPCITPDYDILEANATYCEDINHG